MRTNRFLPGACLATITACALTGCDQINTMVREPVAQASTPAERVERRDGWLMLKLSGTPYEIGHVHGLALAPEIDDAIKENILTKEHGDEDDPAMTWAWA